jgi:hypothetical protein
MENANRVIFLYTPMTGSAMTRKYGIIRAGIIGRHYYPGKLNKLCFSS